MKKLVLLGLALVAETAMTATARADEAPTPTPEVIFFEAIPTPTPEPPQRGVHYNEHEISAEAIDEMASIFWADCNTDEEKLCFAAVAVNRLVYGDPFGDTLEGVLSAKGEFNHGHISDKNREKAKRFLNMALTQYVDGEYAGLLIPSIAVYIGRDKETRKLVLYDIDFTEVYRMN